MPYSFNTIPLERLGPTLEALANGLHYFDTHATDDLGWL